MKHTMMFALIAAGCATAQTVPEPEAVPFAAAYLEREAVAVPGTIHDGGTVDGGTQEHLALPPKPSSENETRGLLQTDSNRMEELRRLAADEDALTAFFSQPVSRADLEALAYLRSPAIRAARERLTAARTGYRQSADLKDLVALYRSYLRETKTRVGPEKSRRATGSIAPYPNIDALSGELVARNVAIAFEKLRSTVRDTVAAAERARANAAHLANARRIVAADIALHDSLVKVMRARLESGKSTQAALLAFQARLESLRTELAVLQQKEAAVRAQWNRLLNRAEQAPVNLEIAPSKPEPGTSDAPQLVRDALVEQQALRVATLAAERAAVAVRLAETMTLPRMDLGSSRFERERAGEAGVQRGNTFPDPGRMVRPRSDFGVREAQVTEMRARSRATERSRDAVSNRTQADVRAAWFALDAAQRRFTVHKQELVPLAERAFDSTRGAYEGNRTGYIELLDSARRLLKARLGLVDARRDFAHADAQLLQAVGVRTAIKR